MADERREKTRHALFESVAKPGDSGDREALLDEYKLFVDTAEKASARRQVVNGFFLSINSILLGAAGVMAKLAFDKIAAVAGVLALAIAGILLCFLWRAIIRNYRQLNSAKFEVIHLIEEHLPAAPFKAEWVALGEGKDPDKYKPISGREEGVAIVFLCAYAVAFLGAVVFLICGRTC